MIEGAHLICNNCKKFKFRLIESTALMSLPPIYHIVYQCVSCGDKITVERRDSAYCGHVIISDGVKEL